jgi:hypothetical protein
MAITDALPAWVALAALALLAAMVYWTFQRQAVWQAGEARVSQAEARVATAEAALDAMARRQSATATAVAYAASPEAAVGRSLAVVLAAGQEPTEQRLRALSDAFAPAALSVMRPEVEHLVSGGLHLGGQSTYELMVLETAYASADQAQVRARERWTYDERRADNERARCLIESSEQIYTLNRAGSDWRVVDIDVIASSRADCGGP